MIVSNNQLKKYITGAVYFEENEGIIPYRFTKEQLEATYDRDNEIRHRTSTGIKIDFFSDTEEVSFDYTIITSCSSSLYNLYYFDIYVDNSLVLHRGEKNIAEGTKGRINLSLKKGNKHIVIYLPGSCAVEISDFFILDGAKIEANQYSKNVMFFGDSITHAAYIDFPSLSYVNILTRKLNYNYINQAIGGDIFDKKHLKFLPYFKPDTVFVAYGTNDWRWANSNLPERVEEYFSILKSFYANSEINVILPIWRGDTHESSELKYSFSEAREIIKRTAEKYDLNVYDGINFVPHYELLLHDGYLHPNESGFVFYADALEKCINKTDI